MREREEGGVMESVYVDIYFLINVSMDFLCLMIAAALMHRAVKRWRAVLGAVFGGGYAVAALLLGWGGALGIVLDLLAVTVACLITFGRPRGSWWLLLRTVGVTWLASAVMGGVMTVLYSWLNRLDLPFEALQGDGLSVWTFVIVSAISGLLTVKGGRFLGVSGKAKSATVELELFGHRKELRALVDTGNLLRDPVTGKSVIVVELDAVAPLLPPEMVRACEKGDFSSYPRDHERAKRIRLIPAGTASGSALLLAIVPDRVCVRVKGEEFSSNHLIAPRHLHLADYDAIIGQ